MAKPVRARNLLVKKGQERRLSQRFNILLSLRYQVLKDGVAAGELIDTYTHDISVSGVSFDSAIDIPIDTMLKIELFIPQRLDPLLLVSRVARIEHLSDESGYRIGVEFADMRDVDREAVMKSIQNLDLFDLLNEVVKREASDLHLTIGRPPVVRIQGKLNFLEREPIRPKEIEAMIYPLLKVAQIQNLEKNRELDFAFSPDINSRFRVNLHWQRGCLEGAFRTIPTKIKTPEELGLPAGVMDFAAAKRGLVLVAGPTNSGKSTTMSAMVEAVNRKENKVIICIEDPIEFVHQSKQSIIKQRELGVDTLSYAEALRRSLRQDPDIVIVGEAIDVQCVLAALQAAETGHLVITSIHATNSVQALERIIHMFPVEHKDEICIRLSTCLQGVIAQLLLPSVDGVSQVMATEILIANNAVRHIVRENKLHQLQSVMETGGQMKMHTFEKSVDELFTKGQISGDTMTNFLLEIAARRGDQQQI